VNVTLTTSFRTIPSLDLTVWKNEFKKRNSPLTASEIENCYAACEGWAVALDQSIGETSLKDADAIRDKNLLRLTESNGSTFKRYSDYWKPFAEYIRRVYDPAYKGGVYYPAHLGVGGIVPGYDLSLAGYKVIYQGGPACLNTRGQTCANGERYDPLKSMLGMATVNDTSAPSINRSIAASMERYGHWFSSVPPDTSSSTTTTPKPPPAGTVKFGLVPKPIWIDRQIPDANNWAWDNLGQRMVKGVVYHRQVGTNWGTDGWFRGGGGGAGLTDFGIDRNSGETLEWNSYLGLGRRGISPNRSGWASGPWENPPGDGRAFVSTYGTNAINRDLVSLEIDGWYDTPISKAGFDKIVHMSAYLADQKSIRWDGYPLNPHTGLTFTYTHNEFQGHKPCPGGVVLGQVGDIIAATKKMMQKYQQGV
jgi:hypothetical protein